MSKTTCKFCNKKFYIKALEDHLPECIINNIQNENGYLIEFTSEGGITKKHIQCLLFLD